MITVPVSVETLQEIRAVLIGIEDDLACNLTPRSERLQYGRDLIWDALNAERSFESAKIEQEPSVARFFRLPTDAIQAAE